MLERATKPEERRVVVARMKDTLVQAKLGLDDLRDALAKTRRTLESERKELETVRRRRELAVGINDAETVAVAERFQRQHEDRVRVLEDKLAVQTREVELAEREVDAMKAEIRSAMAGVSPPARGAPDSLDDPLADETGAEVREELDTLARERARADRDADVSRKLEELKRKMGK